MTNMNQINFYHPEKDEIIIPISNVYSSLEVLDGILKISSHYIGWLCPNITILLKCYHLLRTTNEKMNFKSRLKCIVIYHIFNASKK